MDRQGSVNQSTSVPLCYRIFKYLATTNPGKTTKMFVDLQMCYNNMPEDLTVILYWQ